MKRDVGGTGVKVSKNKEGEGGVSAKISIIDPLSYKT